MNVPTGGGSASKSVNNGWTEAARRITRGTAFVSDLGAEAAKGFDNDIPKALVEKTKTAGQKVDTKVGNEP